MQGETEKKLCALPVCPLTKQLHYVQRPEQDSEKSSCSIQATQVTAVAIKMPGVCLQ